MIMHHFFIALVSFVLTTHGRHVQSSAEPSILGQDASRAIATLLAAFNPSTPGGHRRKHTGVNSVGVPHLPVLSARTQDMHYRSRHRVTASSKEEALAQATYTDEELEHAYNVAGESIKLAEEYRETWQLKKAAEECGKAIEAIPIDMMSTQHEIAQYLGNALRIAKIMRAEYNLDMGYPDKTICELREIMELFPESDADAKIQLARAFHDSKGKSEQALQLVDSVFQAGLKGRFAKIGRKATRPEGGPIGLGEFLWAAQDAGTYAASLGKHKKAKEYSGTFGRVLKDFTAEIDPSKKMALSQRLVFFELLNAKCAGDEKSAARATKEQQKMMGTALRQKQELLTSSWDYIATTPLGSSPQPSLFYGPYGLLNLAIDASSVDTGLVLEFGVWHGSSLRMIATRFPDQQVHGFDTFEGLPEKWSEENPVGAYSSQGLPEDMPDNVQFHKGIFSDTLPGFLDTHPGPIRLMNIDCDLYSSTKDIFEKVFDRVVPGTVIVFDEYLFTGSWKNDEYKAFQEAVEQHGWKYEYLAFNTGGQAVIRIVDS